MATRCFSPPLSFSPRSPTRVLQPGSVVGVWGGMGWWVGGVVMCSCFGSGRAGREQRQRHILGRLTTARWSLLRQAEKRQIPTTADPPAPPLIDPPTHPPAGMRAIAASSLAAAAAACTSDQGAPGRPYATLWRMVSLKRTVSCLFEGLGVREFRLLLFGVQGLQRTVKRKTTRKEKTSLKVCRGPRPVLVDVG